MVNELICNFVCVRSGSQALQQLPARWLSEVLEEVKASDPSSKLCATRRSAGIPFYIQVCKHGFQIFTYKVDLCHFTTQGRIMRQSL